MKCTWVIAVLAACVAAGPTPDGHALHEKRDEHPQWAKGARADPSLEVPVRIGMVQKNLERGHDLLMEVSHPDSPKYGKYYTQDEIIDLFAPSDETVDAIKNWLVDSGIAAERVGQSANKQWMMFDGTVAELESLLKSDFHIYKHVEQGDVHIATEAYHVPELLRRHIDYITPGIKLVLGAKAPGASVEKRNIEKRTDFRLPILKEPLPISIESTPSSGNLSKCDTVITPPCIKALYNISNPTSAVPGNQLGIFESLGDHYSPQDLNAFFAVAAPNIPAGTRPQPRLIDGAIGAVPAAQAGTESDLDFQISYPIIYPQQTVLFQVDDEIYEEKYVFRGFLNNFLDAIDGSYCSYSAYGINGNSRIDPPYPHNVPGGYKGKLQCGKFKPTNVISISYGGQEADVPVNYFKRQCNEYLKLGMQGISVVVASGDYGVAGPDKDDTPNGCLLKNNMVSKKVNGTIFSPGFPVSCPYVTTVGGTFLPTGASVTKDQERAVARFPSGGGFSNIFPRPSYQNAAVSRYLTQYRPPYPSYSTTDRQNIGANGGIYNSNGRGYPDVSAVGDRVFIYNNKTAGTIGGTSASAPLFAAILTRINEERLNAGRPTVGFVNPTLYSNPSVFHDILIGSNPGCNTTGFAVQPGWDPVTGLGTPNYPALLKVFTQTSQPPAYPPAYPPKKG